MWATRQFRRFFKNGTRIVLALFIGLVFIFVFFFETTNSSTFFEKHISDTDFQDFESNRLAGKDTRELGVPFEEDAPGDVSREISHQRPRIRIKGVFQKTEILNRFGSVELNKKYLTETQHENHDPLFVNDNFKLDGRKKVVSSLYGDNRRDRKNTALRRNGTRHFIDGVEYPMLTSDGNFIPIRRWVHIDMKGAPYRVSYYKEIFPFLRRMKVNGVLLEWEDMFPYQGDLSVAVNGNAYTMDEVKEILAQAKANGLEIVPLVQTFGHLEWMLKLKEFAHLRDDFRYPQVICIGSPTAWRLITDMIEQVGRAHTDSVSGASPRFFHIGADEIFYLGECDATAAQMRVHGGRERAVLWHITRTAAYVRRKFNSTVLAWHDMLERATVQDIYDFNADKLVEPVLWSYAEDLKQYLSYTTWLSLKPFKNIWAASVYKGADGPMRYSSNPIHYIRNHESWTMQLDSVQREFDYIQGMIFSGWSRYDHLAILCETFPVALPTLAMCLETILAGRALSGQYDHSYELLACRAPYEPGYVYGCTFPGHRVYELINELHAQHVQLEKYRSSDYDLNGWLSELNKQYNYSSPMNIEKILPFLDGFLKPMEHLVGELRSEMSRIFFDDAAEEFIATYAQGDLRFLRACKATALDAMQRRVYERRPFVRHQGDDDEIDTKNTSFRL